MTSIVDVLNGSLSHQKVSLEHSYEAKVHFGVRWIDPTIASGLQAEDSRCSLISHIGARGINRNAVGTGSKDFARATGRTV